MNSPSALNDGEKFSEKLTLNGMTSFIPKKVQQKKQK
jgi:hypothetical protein